MGLTQARTRYNSDLFINCQIFHTLPAHVDDKHDVRMHPIRCQLTSCFDTLSIRSRERLPAKLRKIVELLESDQFGNHSFLASELRGNGSAASETVNLLLRFSKACPRSACSFTCCATERTWLLASLAQDIAGLACEATQQFVDLRSHRQHDGRCDESPLS